METHAFSKPGKLTSLNHPFHTCIYNYWELTGLSTIHDRLTVNKLKFTPSLLQILLKLQKCSAISIRHDQVHVFRMIAQGILLLKETIIFPLVQHAWTVPWTRNKLEKRIKSLEISMSKAVYWTQANSGSWFKPNQKSDVDLICENERSYVCCRFIISIFQSWIFKQCFISFNHYISSWNAFISLHPGPSTS